MQSDMQDLIETRMADEIARDQQRSTVVAAVSATNQRRDTSATLVSSPTHKKHFFLRWTW